MLSIDALVVQYHCMNPSRQKNNNHENNKIAIIIESESVYDTDLMASCLNHVVLSSKRCCVRWDIYDLCRYWGVQGCCCWQIARCPHTPILCACIVLFAPYFCAQMFHCLSTSAIIFTHCHVDLYSDQCYAGIIMEDRSFINSNQVHVFCTCKQEMKLCKMNRCFVIKYAEDH
jgi:hypothetical protein